MTGETLQSENRYVCVHVKIIPRLLKPVAVKKEKAVAAIMPKSPNSAPPIKVTPLKFIILEKGVVSGQ